MQNLNVELCPETGMCSIVRESGEKADLMPDEVVALRESANDANKVREIIAAGDATFAASLSAEELKRIAAKVAAG